MDGYIKLSRSFFDNEIWQAARAFNESEAWLDLIQSARFEPSVITSRIGSYEVTWGRGEYPASVRFLSRKWGRSERWTRNLLSKLKKNGMIDTRDGGGVSVIRLLNYDKYNGDTPSDTLNNVIDSNLQEKVTQMATQLEELSRIVAEKRHTSDTKTNKGEEKEKKKENTPKGVQKKEENFVSEEFEYAFNLWLCYKKERNEMYKNNRSLKVCYNQLVRLSGNVPEVARAIVEQSIAREWKGLFELKEKSNLYFEQNEKLLELLAESNYKKFVAKVKQCAPYCFANMRIPEESEFESIKAEAGNPNKVLEAIMQIENNKSLRSNRELLGQTIKDQLKFMEKYG